MAKEKHVVEIHIGKDVFSHDYGSETCAFRAIDRLKETVAIGAVNVRYWIINGKVQHLAYSTY